MDYDEDFDQYIEKFKKYSTKTKEDIVYNQMKLLASLTNKICKLVGAENNLVINKELVDLVKKDYTQDDYYEAMIVLINSVQCSIEAYHNKIYDNLKQLMDTNISS